MKIEMDEETGQYYYRARMYSTEQCRFTTQDPAGMQEGPNMYAYVGNNPMNHRDPTGLLAGEDKIDGGGGGSSPCYQLPAYDTMEECQQNWDYEYCVEHCYDGSGGSGGVDISFVELNDNNYENCLEKSFVKRAALMGIPCIVGAMTVAVLAGIVTVDAIISIVLSETGPGAIAVSGAANVGIISATVGSCVGFTIAAKFAHDVIYCGLKSVEL